MRYASISDVRKSIHTETNIFMASRMMIVGVIMVCGDIDIDVDIEIESMLCIQFDRNTKPHAC